MTEEFRIIPDTEGMYSVSNLGRVRNLGKTISRVWQGYNDPLLTCRQKRTIW